MADTKYGESWTDAELEACVIQYQDVITRGGASRSISKDIFISRALRNCPGRNEGAILRRMGNISAVRESHGKPIVIGWKPQSNVGSGVEPRLLSLILQHEPTQG